MANDDEKTMTTDEPTPEVISPDAVDAVELVDESAVEEVPAETAALAPPPVPSGPPKLRRPDDPMEQTAHTPHLEPHESYMPDKPPVNMLVISGIVIAISIVLTCVGLIEYLGYVTEQERSANAAVSEDVVREADRNAKLLTSCMESAVVGGQVVQRKRPGCVPVKDAREYLLGGSGRLKVQSNWKGCTIQNTPKPPPAKPGGPATP